MTDAELIFQPRFLSYAKAHGRAPDEMLASDMREFPGGTCAGLICWISARRAEFFKKSPDSFIGYAIVDFAAFNAFLEERATEQAAAFAEGRA